MNGTSKHVDPTEGDDTEETTTEAAPAKPAPGAQVRANVAAFRAGANASMMGGWTE